jgi:hypothetical protein
MKGDLRYTPSDVFETFPFPLDTTSLEDIGACYYTHRQSIMQARQEGLTDTYNRFHRESETVADIVNLRELHKEMDEAVAQAYGWDDLALEHGFYQTKQGPRYTISERARREVLGRLLKLNHERYAAEVAEGLHEKGATKGKGGKKAQGGKQKGTLYVVDTAQPAPEVTSPGILKREYWINAWQAGEQKRVAEEKATYSAQPLIPDETRPELWEQAQEKEDADGEAE